MTKLLLTLSAVGAFYLLDALWDGFFKNKWGPLMKFGQVCAISFAAKCLVKLAIWAINF